MLVSQKKKKKGGHVGVPVGVNLLAYVNAFVLSKLMRKTYTGKGRFTS